MAAHRSVILGVWSHWLIDKREILDLAVQTSLTPHVIEKDYVLGWMLAGIYAHEELAESWIHRGNLVGFFVIRSFRDKTTEAVFNGESPKGFPADLVKVARRKLRYLNAAGDLGDLRSPPGNRLEALAGDRKGQHSIRINDQFRVCFVWTAEGPAEVEIVDYH